MAVFVFGVFVCLCLCGWFNVVVCVVFDVLFDVVCVLMMVLCCC